MKWLFILLILLPSFSIAGGDAWNFNISSLHIDGSSYKLEIESLEPNNTLVKNCKKVTIIGQYSIRWLIFGGEHINRKNHMAALEKMKDTFNENKKLSFGLVGEGLMQEPQSPCIFNSLGLTVVEKNGTFSVLSFYKWP